MVGLGGIFAEILQDSAVQMAPVSEAQAMAMLKSLKAFAVLNGARGRPRADLEAAAGAIAALSRFAAARMPKRFRKSTSIRCCCGRRARVQCALDACE